MDCLSYFKDINYINGFSDDKLVESLKRMHGLTEIKSMLCEFQTQVEEVPDVNMREIIK